MKADYWKLAAAAGLFIFYLQWFREENYYSFLDFVNLAFHEAGHVFTAPLGRFVSFTGGTLFQVGIPALCALHLYRLESRFGYQLCVFWTGQNLLNVSIYVKDAIRQELPLVGGGEHDWTYLLEQVGLLARCELAGKLVFFAGSAVIFYSLGLIVNDALRKAAAPAPAGKNCKISETYRTVINGKDVE